MADISELSNIIRQINALQAGYREPGQGTLDKIDRVSGILSSGAKDIISNVLAIKRANIENEKLKADAQKIQLENKPLRSVVESPQASQTISDISTLPADKVYPLQDLQSGKLDTMQSKINRATQQQLEEERKLPNISIGQAKEYGSYIKSITPQKEALSLQPAIASGYVGRDFAKLIFPELGENDDVSIGQLQQQVQLLKQQESFRNQGELQKSAAEIKETAENRAKNKADLKQITEIQTNLSSAKEILDKIPEGVQGGLQSLASKSGLVYENASTYERTKPALATSLYRAMTGDTRLSDADAAARALPLMPSLYQSGKQRESLFNFINKAIENRKNKLSKGIKEVTWEDVLNDYEDLGQSNNQSVQKYKVGEQKIINGITYERREDKKWHPLSR